MNLLEGLVKLNGDFLTNVVNTRSRALSNYRDDAPLISAKIREFVLVHASEWLLAIVCALKGIETAPSIINFRIM